MKQSKVFIYGRHAVSEALKYAPHALTKLYLEGKADTKLRAQADKLRIPTGRLSEGLARSDMKSGSPHQGIVASVSLAQLMRNERSFMEELSVTPATCLVVLSGVQDPHNVGAIIRSAAGFGAAGVLLPERNQSPVTGAVIKVSAGMAFRVPLVSIPDLPKTIKDLKKRGFTVYGLEGAGAEPISGEAFSGPTAFVLGNESSGIESQVRALCDTRVSIPIHARAESLNVAAAAAVALYEWSTAHREALE